MVVVFPTPLTPEISNGSVYFYLHAESSISCLTSNDIFLSIPSAHSWAVYTDYATNTLRNYFEIYYETSNGFKSTGIIFDR